MKRIIKEFTKVIKKYQVDQFIIRFLFIMIGLVIVFPVILLITGSFFEELDLRECLQPVFVDKQGFVSWDLKPGAVGTIEKREQGELHNLVIPIDAVIFDDTTGATYIYVKKEREGILGTETYLEKYKVTVKDKNDFYVALEAGVISKEDEIVVYHSKEVKQGDVVRVDIS